VVRLSVATPQLGDAVSVLSRPGLWLWGLVFVLAAQSVAPPAAWPHDIPNQRVDRSIQVTVLPGALAIDYEVSLSELTLTQDLRSLTGSLPGGDRTEWLALYAQVTGPLDAKGLAVTVDGQPVTLGGQHYDLVVEEHPRFTFHFEAKIAEQGRLSVRDRNYVSSEGTSRLAVRGRGGVAITGDDLPADVEQIPVRPVWQLSDAEERRSKQVDVRYSRRLSNARPAGAKAWKRVPARHPAPGRFDV
jgi:nickel/cobalt exporter